MSEDWKVQLVEQPGRYGYDVYIYRLAPERRREFITNGGEMIQTVAYGDAEENNIKFAFLEPQQLLSLVEAFSQKGHKTLNDHKAEGLLEATNRHLEDMRTLVFKGKK